MSRRLVVTIVVLALLAAGCSGPSPSPTVGPIADEIPTFPLYSDAFADGEPIPSSYTCDGDNISPPLNWADPPAGTETFALIVDDPDAPGGTWVHWVLFNIPGDLRALEPGAGPPEGSVTGVNGWGRNAYGGPCPPLGTHRYVFTLYALNTTLTLDEGATKDDVLKAAEGHAIGLARLTGTYSR